jgi:hypothetical protein
VSPRLLRVARIRAKLEDPSTAIDQRGPLRQLADHIEAMTDEQYEAWIARRP